MKIQVLEHMTIAELQHAFREYFPFLSLAFFTQPHDIYQSSPVKYLITDLDTQLQRIEPEPHSATVEILVDMTVNELEELFEQEFGLHVQVYRKDGNTWTETTITDNLSLRSQNTNAAEEKDLASQISLHKDYKDARTEWYMG